MVRTASFNAATCTFSVPARTGAVFWAVRPAAEQLALLKGEVDKLVAAGALSGGQGNALKTKLNAAIQKLQQGQTGPAANQVQAFINQVQDLVSNGVLTAEQGQALIADAQAAVAAMQ